MDVFERRDSARGQLGKLVVLFVLAVALIVLTPGLLLFLYGRLVEFPEGEFSPQFLAAIGASVAVPLLGVGIGIAHKTSQLRPGGLHLARLMGAHHIATPADHPLEQRFVNVLEEMAIAAGLPVPPAMVLREEAGVNAFVAGWSSDDAVVVVTQGALRCLNRRQLQALVAHEIGHIVHEDCALNMRLLGAIHGLMALSAMGSGAIRLAGYLTRINLVFAFIAAFFMACAGLLIKLLGLAGALLGRMIQSMISRSRELLADATALQLTRDPEALAGVLAATQAAGSAMGAAGAEEMGHMTFADPEKFRLVAWVATHPSFQTRIENSGSDVIDPAALLVDPRANEEEARAEIYAAEVARKTAQVHGGGEALELPEDAVERARALIAALPAELHDAAHGPFASRALLLALMMAEDKEGRKAQYATLRSDQALELEVGRLYPFIEGLRPELVLPLFDIALGTVAALSRKQVDAFLTQLVGAMGALSPGAYESYCLATIARRHLRPEGGSTRAPIPLKQAMEIVLSILAHEGHDEPEAAGRAFDAGCIQLGSSDLQLAVESEHTVHALDSALAILLRAPLPTRESLLHAAEVVAARDGELREVERMLVRTLYTALGLPRPESL